MSRQHRSTDSQCDADPARKRPSGRPKRRRNMRDIAAATEAEKRALIERLSQPSGKSEEEKIELASTVIQRAVRNGLEEVQVYRFPNTLCTDKGRAINQQEAGLGEHADRNSKGNIPALDRLSATARLSHQLPDHRFPGRRAGRHRRHHCLGRLTAVQPRLIRKQQGRYVSQDDAPHGMKRKAYEKELRKLQVELCHLQQWVKAKNLRAIILFEGRDTAGKGGTIKAHHRTGQSARVSGGGAARAFGPGKEPDVLPALHAAFPGAREKS